MPPRANRSRILLLAGLSFAGLGADEGEIHPLSPWVGQSIPAGNDPAGLGSNRNQAEPHLARSPVSDDLLLATFQEARLSNGGAQGNGVAVSRDGGFTWDRQLLPHLTLISGGPYYRATDPVVAIDRENHLYHQSLVAMDDNFDLGRIVVQRSDDWGVTWSDPVTVYTGQAQVAYSIFPDKNWMTVNSFANTPTTGRVISTWTDFRDITLGTLNIHDAPIMLSYSDDRGESWSQRRFVTPEPTVSNSTKSYQGSQPLFLPDGSLLVIFHEFIEVGGNVFIRGNLRAAYSADGGVTFSRELEALVRPYQIYGDTTLRNGGFLPSAAVASDTGDVFVAYQARFPTSADRSRILLVRSRRDGSTSDERPVFNWSEPMAVDDAGVNATAMFATIAVTPDGRTIAISYYTRRHSSPGSSVLDHYITLSYDGGATWSQSTAAGDLRVTPESFDASKATNTSSGYMIGDYFGLAAPNREGDAFALCWIDTRQGNADPFTARVASSPDSFEGWKQIHFNVQERQARPVSERSDIDGDGFFDLLEAWLGFDPRDPTDRSILANTALHLGRPKAVSGFPALGYEWVSAVRPRDGAAREINPVATPVGENFWESVSYGWNENNLHLRIKGTDEGETKTYAISRGPYPWQVTKLENDSDWFYSAWFGYGYDRHYPWVFHNGLGWVYPGSGSEDRLWLFSPEYGWIFTSRSVYPFLYNASERDWWRYLQTSLTAPRWFYSANAGQWIQR